MKVVIKEGLKHGKPVLRCIARIAKSTKLQIPKSVQCTWCTQWHEETSNYPKEKVSEMFKFQARRWQLSHYKKLFGETIPPAVQAELV